jgi:hypothetical protein
MCFKIPDQVSKKSACSWHLLGIRLFHDVEDIDQTDMSEARAFSWLNNKIDIYSNSWGPIDDGMTVRKIGPLALRALEDGIRRVCKREP